MVTFLTAYLRLENHHLIFLPCSGIFKHFLLDSVTGTEYSGHSWEMRFKPHWLTVPPQPNQESGFWDSHPHIITNPCRVLLRCTRARAHLDSSNLLPVASPVPSDSVVPPSTGPTIWCPSACYLCASSPYSICLTSCTLWPLLDQAEASASCSFARDKMLEDIKGHLAD